MGKLISFEERAVATLRDRLGAAESANQDLIAFARGHSGAVAAIHQAVLEAIAAEDLEAVLTTVTGAWPALLGLDVASVVLAVGDRAFLADHHGVQAIEPALLARSLARLEPVALRSVERGHPLFGAAADSIRAEALVRFDCAVAGLDGLLLLGQRDSAALDQAHGAALLRFLGQSLGAILTRWTGSNS